MQILPQQENLSTLLAQGLGQGVATGAQGIAEQMNKRGEQERQMGILSNLLNQPSQNQNNLGSTQPNMQESVDAREQNILNISQNPEIMARLNMTNPAAYNAIVKTADNIMKKQAMSQKDILQEKKFAHQKELISEKTAAEERKKEYEPHVGKRQNLTKEMEALNLAWHALQSGEVGGFDRNQIANILGSSFESLKSPEGVELEMAAKHLTVAGLNEITGQKNMLLDRLVAQAAPGIGKQKESNEIIVLARMGTAKAQMLYEDAYDSLRAKYKNAGLPLPPNLDQMVHEQIHEEAKNIQDQILYQVQSVKERYRGSNALRVPKKVPKGTYLTEAKKQILMEQFNNDPEAALKEAKRLGYTIPPKSIREKRFFNE